MSWPSYYSAAVSFLLASASDTQHVCTSWSQSINKELSGDPKSCLPPHWDISYTPSSPSPSLLQPLRWSFSCWAVSYVALLAECFAQCWTSCSGSSCYTYLWRVNSCILSLASLVVDSSVWAGFKNFWGLEDFWEIKSDSVQILAEQFLPESWV